MMVVLSDEHMAQREFARQKANEVRLAKAKVKRQIRARERDVRQVVLTPPAHCQRMTISELLDALPRVGRQRAEGICRGICRPNLQLQHMGDTTRGRLVVAIEQRAWWALPPEQAA